MGSLSATHWVLIALVFVLLFGAKRLPDAARGLGRSLRIFKSEMQEMHTEGANATPAAATTAPTAETPTSEPASPAELPPGGASAAPGGAVTGKEVIEGPSGAQSNQDLHRA